MKYLDCNRHATSGKCHGRVFQTLRLWNCSPPKTFGRKPTKVLVFDASTNREIAQVWISWNGVVAKLDPKEMKREVRF